MIESCENNEVEQHEEETGQPKLSSVFKVEMVAIISDPQRHPLSIIALTSNLCLEFSHRSKMLSLAFETTPEEHSDVS